MNRRHFVFGLTPMLLASATAVHAKSGRVEKQINLTGTGKGKARYRIDPGNKRSLSVEVQKLKPLAGKTLAVNVVIGGIPQTVGQLVISILGAGKLELQTEHGQQVPSFQAGDRVIVADGDNTILSGTF